MAEIPTKFKKFKKSRKPLLSEVDGDLDSTPSPESYQSTTKSLADLELEANHLILSAVRSDSRPPSIKAGPSRSNSFGNGVPYMSKISSIMPSLTGLSLSRTPTIEDNGRGRKKEKEKAEGSTSRGSSALRSMSPFRRRSRTRERSPSVEALRQSQSDIDSDSESVGPRSSRSPRNAFGDGDSPSDSDDSDEDSSDQFDDETEDNTEKNAGVEPLDHQDEIGEYEPDPLGEGVNIVRLEEPMFQAHPSIGPSGGPRRKKTLKADVLALETAPPVFQKDRCAVTITHGDPRSYCVGRPGRKYMVASDLSEESKYAVEWGIGTVLKDGDEMTIVTVSETETKLDSTGPQADRMAKLRNQQERQALAYLLVRQATALLQRTRLNVTVKCQAIHAKNSRHTLLDIIDVIQPIMVIVGSRGIGKLKGILLGSTSHYLIQKSSVPVMVARRRLKRAVRHSQMPPKRTKHVSLAEANIDKAGKGSAEKNVQALRAEIAQEEASRQKVGIAPTLSPTSPISPAMDSALQGAAESDSDSDSEEGVKVPGAS
ncbi:hypothetical protein M408DRAFT_329071 [Serendipita vermifera MAFF 305830]|uniref:UspA domain-containing protein n=1 Tax=Serendipita vermifera MAFF 305830 TaxID=933852 RepID=A0A0C3BC83_SERVB|nr:hypothetical protein M408DRAFT_329071 [Serendipita vermifera MAFF 305830]